MKLQRKSVKVTGVVNFPVESKEYPNSGEGGMVVKLVVIGNKRSKSSWEYGVCCGASVTEVMAEQIVGDDKRPMPRDIKAFTGVKSLQKHMERIREWDEFYFPNLNDPRIPTGVERYFSVGFAAVIVMGSTGWSGYSPEKGSWVCKYSDLTDDGKELYNMVKKMYPKHELHLLTYLDT